MYRIGSKLFCFVCLVVASIFSSSSQEDASKFQLYFQSQHNDGIYVIDDVDEATPQIRPISHTVVPTEKCHGNHSQGRANIIDFDLDPANDRLVWLSWNERLYSSSLQLRVGDDQQQQAEEEETDELLFWYDYYDYVQFSSRRVAVDQLNGMIYLIDRFVNPTVEVVDTSGKYRAVILSLGSHGKIKDSVFEGKMPMEMNFAEYQGVLFHQEYPMNIALDPEQGVMFIRTNLSCESKIYRADMDGTSLKEIVSSTGKISAECTQLELDRANKRVYWNDCEGGKIESSDYSGEGRVTVVANVLGDLAGLSIYDDRLFFSDFCGVVRACQLVDKVCPEDKIRELAIPTESEIVPEKIKVAAVARSNRTVTNPCQSNECDHLCLLKSDGGHSCACKLGHLLATDGRTCQPILASLVYLANNFIRSSALEPRQESRQRQHQDYPSQFVTGILEGARPASIDYHPQAEMILYQECCIGSMPIDLDANLRGSWYTARGMHDCFLQMVYDSKAHKTYLTKMNDDKYSLNVAEVPAKFERNADLHPVHLRDIDKPLSMTLHPESGSLFLLTEASTADSKKSVLRRIDTNAAAATNGEDQLEIILKNNITEELNIRSLAVDCEADGRLYAYTESGMILRADLSGQGVEILGAKSPVERVDAMLVDGDWIYVKNRTTIWRMDKSSGEKAECIVPEQKDVLLRSNMKIVRKKSDELHYGDSYSLQNAACNVFCAYKKHQSESANEDDAALCTCLNENNDIENTK
ncbi:hypothetical protein TKK_0000097 [Trichogramma kaykai]|uniref:EGF-like domain-containing protein n=1 Tax=Trichogramma kaykai TaxID=54128 RepID=A0ABD2VSM6_9HYME